MLLFWAFFVLLPIKSSLALHGFSAEEFNASHFVRGHLLSLPEEERDAAHAVNLCRDANPETYCAWVVYSGESKVVENVTCFSDLRHHCLPENPTAQEAYNHSTACSQCSGCQPMKCKNPLIGCKTECFCSCYFAELAHRLLSTKKPNKEKTIERWKEDSGLIYPCHDACDGMTHCENSGADEVGCHDDSVSRKQSLLLYVSIFSFITFFVTSLGFFAIKRARQWLRDRREAKANQEANDVIYTPVAASESEGANA